MRNCDIKFVNKEIPPSVVFPCSSSCLTNAVSMSALSKVTFLSKVPTGGTNHSCSYWDCLQVCGVAPAVSGILTLCAMTQRFATCLAGSAGPTTGLANAISTSSRKPSTNACSATFSSGSSRNCCSTITPLILTLR